VSNRIIASWARRCQAAMLELGELWHAVAEKQAGRVQDVEFTIGRLHHQCWSTSESALLLAAEEKLWDAEILTRTVLEGTFQALAICFTEPDARVAVTHEYLVDLPAINSIRRHRRAEIMLKMTGRAVDHPLLRPIADLLLPAEELTELERRYPRKQRMLLEERWAFTKLIERVSTMNGSCGELAGMVWPYVVASPIAHMGGDALLTMAEREARSDERRRAIALAHGARLVQDQLSLAWLRTLGAYHVEELDLTAVSTLINQQSDSLEDLRDAYARWYVTEYRREG
jgi:hypothetical protein